MRKFVQIFLFIRRRVCMFSLSEAIKPEIKNNKMNHTIITSERYIAIKSAYGLTFNKTLRILTRDHIVPCRWNHANKRLESVSINTPDAEIMMYGKSRQIEAKLAAAGICFEWINEAQAEALTT